MVLKQIIVIIIAHLVVFHCLRAGYGSESEADDEAATVSLATDMGRVNRATNKSAVKLQEIGPRMTLQLIKIEEGLCAGGVIFDEYGNNSKKEHGKDNDDDVEEGEEGEDDEEEADEDGEDNDDDVEEGK